MKFSTSFRGYSPKEVDDYIAELEQKERNLRNTQKQHIDELADENFALRRANQAYQQNERAISQALVDANNLSRQMQGNAQKFAEVTLQRAKVFYVAWSAYAKTLIATLSDEEVKRFNELKDKIERTINAYEGGDVASYARTISAQMELDSQKTQFTAATAAPATTFNAGQEQIRHSTAHAPTPSGAGNRLVNPIEKVQQASGHTIDLRELVRPTESLADLCRDLGLDVDDTADK